MLHNNIMSESMPKLKNSEPISNTTHTQQFAHHYAIKSSHNVSYEHILTAKQSNNSIILPTGTFFPQTVAKIYNQSTSFTGVGQKIGIIELGGGYTLSDITSYLTTIGVNFTGSITSVSVSGATNNINDGTGSNSEVYLDIEIIASVATGATIRVYFAPNSTTGFITGVNQAVADGCNIISISWGSPEKNWGSSLTTFNQTLANAVAKRCIIFVAAGDNGSLDGISGTNVDFPSSSPYVIACGGTSLIATTNNVITSEKVWNNSSSSATGGGVSSTFTKPSYQSNVTTTPAATSTKRCVPDISGDADPATGYCVAINGGGSSGVSYQIYGGTSAVAPLWSAIIAINNSDLGKNIQFYDLQNVLYQSPVGSLCNDITIGTNGAYSASIGYDLCTGNGSPRCINIYNSFKTNYHAPSSSITPSVVSGNAPLNVTFGINNFNPVSTYSWNFGDNTISVALNPVHIYTINGVFTVSLTENNSLSTNITTTTITVSPVQVQPIAIFAATLYSNNVRFVALANTSLNTTSYSWNFGDNVTSTLAAPSHTYTAEGTYTISLTAINNTLSSVSTIKVIII